MPRHATKIVATLGPASSDPALLEQMILAGVSVVRLNFSHGKAQDHIDRANLVRQAAKNVGREVAIMADLQGPKIRVGKFADGKVMLVNGEKLSWTHRAPNPVICKASGSITKNCHATSSLVICYYSMTA